MESESAGNKSAIALDVKRRKIQRKRQRIFGIAGVEKIILSEETQKSIQCVVGDDLNTEDPYKYVLKDDLLDDIQFNDKSSEFYPFQSKIMKYPEPNLLMWYYPEEDTDYDVFAFCLTKEAEETVKSIILKLQEKQQARLLNAIEKKIKPWTTLGSESELIEYLYMPNRPLIEIELETLFPYARVGNPVLKMRQVLDAKDGYMEFFVTEGLASFIVRKKIDNQSQIAPIFQTKGIQAGEIKGHNNSTQYSLDFIENIPITEELVKRVRRFNEKKSEELFSFLRMNRQINFYQDEYEELAKISSFDDKPTFSWMELMNILGVKLFKGKMVSHMSWHHLWSGIVLVAYVDNAPAVYRFAEKTQDEVLNVIFGKHYAALYAIDDAVEPKLIFEAPREIMKIACCPYDEYLIVGGLENGQVIVWDMTNRYEKIRAPNVLSTEMKKYKQIMGGMIYQWMQNVYNEAMVLPAALSDPRYSHKSLVTSLNFVHPWHCYTKMGKLEEVSGGYNSYQFITTGEDGTILVWDLRETPKFQAGGFKPRKFRRLQKKPSSLVMDESPYKRLHLNLKPIYKIYFPSSIKNVSITYASISVKTQINYELRPGQKPQNRWDATREPRIVYYNALPMKYDLKSKRTHIGTLEGQYYEVDWIGKDFDSGEVVNTESARLINVCKEIIHDGPISATSYSPELKTLLTTGGRVFALWRDDYPGKPIVWRRLDDLLVWGRWDNENYIRCILVTQNAVVHIWSLSADSYKPVMTESIGNRSTTSMEVHPRPLLFPHYGIADDRGFLRIFALPYNTRQSAQLAIKIMKEFLKSEIDAKISFEKWQKTWNDRHGGSHKEEETKKTETVEAPEEINEETVKKVEIPYHERMKQQYMKMEKDWIAEQIRKKKQTDKKKLEKLRKPLQAIEQEAAEKKLKQKLIKQEAENIFQNTVKTCFPNYFKKVVTDIIDPYSETHTFDDKTTSYDYYNTLKKSVTTFIKKNPHKTQYSWSKALGAMKIRQVEFSQKPYKRKGFPQISFEDDTVKSSSTSDEIKSDSSV